MVSLYTIFEQLRNFVLHTLRVEIFAGINFRAFRGFSHKSRKFVPAKNLNLLNPRKLITAKIFFRYIFFNLGHFKKIHNFTFNDSQKLIPVKNP